MPYVCPKTEKVPRLDTKLMDWCRGHGFTPDISPTAGELELIKNL